jgi:hypothetical protein
MGGVAGKDVCVAVAYVKMQSKPFPVETNERY